MRQNYTSVSAYLKDLQKEFTREYIEATRIVATRQVARLSLVTRKWKNKVVFRRQEKREKGEVIQEIVAEGTPEALAIFGYVDEGTEPHRIEPKKPGGRLVFNTPYQARTAPINKPNAGSGTSGNELVFSTGVDHPGNEARLFVDTSIAQAEDELDMRVSEILNRLD
jgi:hypothetical protein